jgi:predicted neuraminidase
MSLKILNLQLSGMSALIIGIGLIFFAGCRKKQIKIGEAMHPAIVKQEFIYPIGSAPTPQCHASTIAESNGIMIAAWFGGTREKNKDVGIWLSRLENEQWSWPRQVADGVQPDGVRYPCWNPVLFQPRQGQLMLFYKVGPDPEKWWGMLLKSSDHGKTWSEPQKLPAGMLGPIKNKPLQLDEERVLCPSSREDNGWTVHIEFTDPGAREWKSSGPLNDGKTFSAIQPTILHYPQGRLQILCRTENGVIAQCWSEDNGNSWSEMTATALANPNSGIDAVSLKDGRQLLVYNPVSENWGPRVPLSVAISGDGDNWQKVFDLETVTDPETVADEEYSYPAVIQAADGLVHVLYTYNRKTVKHAVINLERIK